ncbi:19426_t:CDS:2, partial [Funneliformis geosporum]
MQVEEDDSLLFFEMNFEGSVGVDGKGTCFLGVSAGKIAHSEQ